MADLQAEVQAAADEMVAAGTETGLQIAVHRHGRVVADVVSGVADPRTATPVSPGTLFYAASAAKGVAASLAHVLAERGDITYDLRLADVWPEFAARGKERTTLRHVLLHTAGLPGLPQETTVADLCDWDRMCAVLAAAEPWWRAGHPVRLPRADLRLPARRDPAPGDRPDRERTPARGADRPARHRGRGLLRRPAPAAAPGGAPGGQSGATRAAGKGLTARPRHAARAARRGQLR